MTRDEALVALRVAFPLIDWHPVQGICLAVPDEAHGFVDGELVVRIRAHSTLPRWWVAMMPHEEASVGGSPEEAAAFAFGHHARHMARDIAERTERLAAWNATRGAS